MRNFEGLSLLFEQFLFDMTYRLIGELRFVDLLYVNQMRSFLRLFNKEITCLQFLRPLPKRGLSNSGKEERSILLVPFDSYVSECCFARSSKDVPASTFFIIS